MGVTPKYGYPGNPVIGVAAPPGFEWRILGNWPHADRSGISREKDQEVSRPTTSAVARKATARREVRTNKSKADEVPEA
jgi:hypothetical protein